MKYCPFCGAESIDGAAFCMECGKPLSTGEGNPDFQPEQELKKRGRRKPRRGKAPKREAKVLGTEVEPQVIVASDADMPSIGQPMPEQVLPVEQTPHQDATQLEATAAAKAAAPQRPTPPKEGIQPDLAAALGYDGYYDFIDPIDKGAVYRQSLDKGLVKKIMIIGGVAVVLIIVSVIMMYLL